MPTNDADRTCGINIMRKSVKIEYYSKFAGVQDARRRAHCKYALQSAQLQSTAVISNSGHGSHHAWTQKSHRQLLSIQTL